MFAYVIIAIELLILYTVFWYVFLREPKPYRIKGNPWGAYDGPDPSIKNFAQGINAYGAQQTHGPNCGCQADQEAKKRSAIYEEWNATSPGVPNVPLTAGELIRSQSRGVERVTRELPINAAASQNIKAGQPQGQMQSATGVSVMPQYAPYNPAEQYRKARTIQAFLAELGDTLNRINVKIP